METNPFPEISAKNLFRILFTGKEYMTEITISASEYTHMETKPIT